MSLTDFQLFLSIVGVSGLVMATIAAIFSVWVYSQVKEKEKKVDRSHREIRKTLASFEHSGNEMMIIVGKLFDVLNASDPAIILRSVEAIESMKAGLEDLPTQVMLKSKSTYGNQMKKEYRIQRQIMGDIDEMVTEETLAAYGEADDGAVAKFLVPIVAEYPEFRQFALKYALGRIQAVTQGGTQPGAVKAHPLG